MRQTIYCVLCVLITLVLGLLAARYVTNFWLLAFIQSLQTHIGLAMIVASLVTLLVRRHWYAMLLLVFAVVLTGHSVMMLTERTAAAAEPNGGDDPSFRVLSFNIDNDNFSNGERIADFILKSDTEIVAISEASPLLAQMSRLREVYPFQVGCGVMTQDCDSLVLSKKPFLKQTIRDLGLLWRYRFIMVTVDIGGRPATVAAAHLSKPYFDDFQRDELRELYYILRDVKEPLVLVGDFNASVIAPGIRFFLARSGLSHAFPEPATWPIAAGAYGISIDHVFVRPPMQITSIERIPDSMGSNHFGLISQFSLK